MKQRTALIQKFQFCRHLRIMITSATTVYFMHTLEDEGMRKISVGTFHSWLKQHQPYVGICPTQSDYCDKCKGYNEEA